MAGDPTFGPPWFGPGPFQPPGWSPTFEPFQPIAPDRPTVGLTVPPEALQPLVRLSDADVERIAQRVVELLAARGTAP